MKTIFFHDYYRLIDKIKLFVTTIYHSPLLCFLGLPPPLQVFTS